MAMQRWTTKDLAQRVNADYIWSRFLTFVSSKAAYGCYIFVAAMWLVPDRRIEKPAK